MVSTHLKDLKFCIDMKFVDRRFLIGKPSQDELQKKFKSNPDDVVRILDEHLRHRSYQILSKRIPTNNKRFGYEVLINPFQYACQSIRCDQLFEFAEYLNTSAVWGNAAPHFLDSAVSTRIFRPMLGRCPTDRVQELADVLNRKGLLRASFENLGYSSEFISREWGITVSA